MEAGLICSVVLAALTAGAEPQKEFRRPVADEAVVSSHSRIVERKVLEVLVEVRNPAAQDAREPGPHSRDEITVSVGIRF